MLRRRAAAAFRSTKPSGRMEARSLRRTVPVIRFHRRTRRRPMRLVGERECPGLQQGTGDNEELCTWYGKLGLPRPLSPLVTVVGGRDGCGGCMCDNWASHCVYDDDGKVLVGGGIWGSCGNGALYCTASGYRDHLPEMKSTIMWFSLFIRPISERPTTKRERRAVPLTAFG
jgi:hypothetical protein